MTKPLKPEDLKVGKSLTAGQLAQLQGGSKPVDPGHRSYQPWNLQPESPTTYRRKIVEVKRTKVAVYVSLSNGDVRYLPLVQRTKKGNPKR